MAPVKSCFENCDNLALSKKYHTLDCSWFSATVGEDEAKRPFDDCPGWKLRRKKKEKNKKCHL